MNVNASQVLSRCTQSPHIEWLWMGPPGYPHSVAGGKDTTVYLDNDGNAFVVLIGNESCAAGSSLIEASLENAPYTSYTTEFTVEPPQPTLPSLPNQGVAPGGPVTRLGSRARESRAPGAPGRSTSSSEPAGKRATPETRRAGL